MAGACTRRAARCSAAPPRSTDWCTCAAMRLISSAGRNRGRAAGAITTCCRTSAAPSDVRQAPTSIAAARARCETRLGLLTNPLARRVARGRTSGRLPAERRHERLSAGRLRVSGHDGGWWPPLQRRQCLPAAGDAPAQSRPAHARARHAHPVRRPARGRDRLPARRAAARGARAPRSHRVRRTHQLAAAAETLGSGAGAGACRTRHRGGARTARRRREPAGPPRVLFPGGVPRAGDSVWPDVGAAAHADRHELDADPRAAWAPAIISRPAASSAAAPAYAIRTSSSTSCRWR